MSSNVKKSTSKPGRDTYPVTPDGRYFVVRGRLWRRTNPALGAAETQAFVHDLMTARRSVAQAKREGDADNLLKIRQEIDRVKRKLGERGPVWWTDGAPDYNRHMVRNTPYGEWFDSLVEDL